VSSLQKKIVLTWELLLAIFIVFLFSRRQFGLVLWTMITNQILIYGSIHSWNTGMIRVNGIIIYRKERSRVFRIVFWTTIAFFILGMNAPGVLILAGWLK
jgi:hypothetical protein